MKSIHPIITLLCLVLMQGSGSGQAKEDNVAGLANAPGLVPLHEIPPFDPEPPREFTPAFAFTLHVVDEDGKPVEGAAFRAAGGFGAVTGLTDENGRAEVEGRSIGFVEIKITKDGFYWSRPEFPQVENDPRDYDEIHREGLRPWNPEMMVVLRRIGNPIPMIVRPYSRAVVSIPVLGEEVAYDLFIGDWLPPYGEGQAADLLVKMIQTPEGELPYVLSAAIRFRNENDGFHPVNSLPAPDSDFLFPRKAPVTDYSHSKLDLRLIMEDAGYRREGQLGKKGYFFRVRTELDETGEVVQAYYGKILGPIEYGLSYGGKEPSGFLTMWLYLNPEPNDRNTEFDTQNNLVPGSPRVYTPPG